MASRNKSNDAPKESGLEAGLAICGVVLFLFGLLWFVSSHKIVYYTTPLFRWMGVPWALVSNGKWQELNEAYIAFRQFPGKIPFPNFLAFINACLMPLAVLLSLASIVYIIKRLTTKSGGDDFKRRLDPMQAAKDIAKVFPAIIPVLHLGPDLVADKLPLWRRQTFPQDIWMNEKVSNRPLAIGNRLFRDRVDTYFRGGEVKDGPHQLRNGRRWSKMLGFQSVDLMTDWKKQSSICFPDRFSAQGKVIFALLCAHAFGGRDGKIDYQTACDQLNRTCAGQPNGLPNLKVAQWLYSKYRMNDMARKLFAIHHWEFTYLFSLFLKAKMSGKSTHTDFIWLKPLDRILFYALNTVGRATPHSEAASVFAIFDYEVKCARQNRLPLRIRADGAMEANICVHTAVEGLELEFVRYQEGTDDDENWWADLQTWDAATRMAKQREMQSESMKAEIAAIKANQEMIAALPVEPMTEYDLDMNAKRKAEEDSAMLEAISAINKSSRSGSSSSSNF